MEINKMSYLHCHNCNFSQDDYWSEGGYNPITYLQSWEKSLFSDKIDEPFTNDYQFIQENGNITLREEIARVLENLAKTIRKMEYRTRDELKLKNPELVCPNCKQKMLDED